MIWRQPSAEDLKLNLAINRVLDDMDRHDPTSPEFSMLLVRLERLNELKQKNKAVNRVSPDQLLMVGGNFLGILTIVAYEQKHVWVSKATNFIMKAH